MHKVAALIKERIAAGDYTVVKGVFAKHEAKKAIEPTKILIVIED